MVIQPFLEYENKWTIILALTSNPGSYDFQQNIVTPYNEDLSLIPHLALGNTEKRLYEHVLEKTAKWGSINNLMYVVGAILTHIRSNGYSIKRNCFKKSFRIHFRCITYISSFGICN